MCTDLDELVFGMDSQLSNASTAPDPEKAMLTAPDTEPHLWSKLHEVQQAASERLWVVKRIKPISDPSMWYTRM